jgi:hypothetical protein
VSETFLHKSGEVQTVDWIFITGGAGLAVTGRIGAFGQKILPSLSVQELVAAPVTSKVFTLLHSSKRSLFEI